MNDTSSHEKEWKCIPCPYGGACGRNSTKSKGVIPMFGFANCNVGSTRGEKFDICLFGPACLGGSNPALIGKFEEMNDTIIANNGGNKDPSKWCSDYDNLNENITEKYCKIGCNTAYTDGSKLCGSCAPEYSKKDLTGKCDECPPPEQNITFAILGTIAGIVGMIIIVMITISDAGQVSGADGIKLILMSTLQMLSLFSTFPIVWPKIFTEIFQIGGTIVVLGQHNVNMKCLLKDVSDLEVFYMTGVFWALVPLLLIVACIVIWYLLACKCIKKEQNYNVKSRIQTSIVALLYLIHPSLCSQAFKLLSCRSVCDSSEQFLHIALDEQCWVGRHQIYVLSLALPMLIIYVLGMPICAIYACYRVKNRALVRKKSSLSLETPSVGKHRRDVSIKIFELEDEKHVVYGVLYSVYKSKYFWWEGTVVLRKIIIAMVGVFGSSLGLLQVHLGLLILAVVILLTSVVQPYDDESETINSKLLQNLELASLAVLWLTLWSGSVFNTYPRCEKPGGVILDHEGSFRALSESGERETLLWCDLMSVCIGCVDIITVVTILFFFLKEKGVLEGVRDYCCCRCCCFKSNATEVNTNNSYMVQLEMASMETSQTGETKVVEDVKVTLTDSNPMHQDKSNKSKQHDVVQERSSQKLAIALSPKSKSKLKKKILTSSRLKATQNVADTTTASEEKAQGTDQDDKNDDGNVVSVKKKSHTRYKSEAGDYYFENVATGETTWKMPDGGTFEDDVLV